MNGGTARIGRPLALALTAVTATAGPAATQVVGERLKLCASCHGEDGNSKLENVPSLAGQPELYTFNQLFLMREGVRKVESMASIVKTMTDEEMTALARHYAGLPAKPSGEPIDAALAARGARLAEERRCASCHLPSLVGQEQMPRVARQRIDYLIATLTSYRDRPRPGADTEMSVAVAGASDGDIKALAHYAASK